VTVLQGAGAAQSCTPWLKLHLRYASEGGRLGGTAALECASTGRGARIGRPHRSTRGLWHLRSHGGGVGAPASRRAPSLIRTYVQEAPEVTVETREGSGRIGAMWALPDGRGSVHEVRSGDVEVNLVTKSDTAGKVRFKRNLGAACACKLDLSAG
jgi:hypothetical protein